MVQKVFDTVPGSTLQLLRNCHLPCFGPQLGAKTIKIFLPFPTIYLHVAGFYHLLNQNVCQEAKCKNRHENPIFCVKPDIKEI